MTEHGGTDALGVVLHGAEDRAKLRRAGFTWRVLVADLVAERRATAPPTPATRGDRGSDLPERPRRATARWPTTRTR